jgi:carboxymethylenebutenolidase
MAVKGEWISYADQTGYFAYPERAALPVPAVIVIQEVGGVGRQIEDVTRRIAAAGYAALAPDLFAVKGIRPAALEKGRITQAMEFMSRLPPAARFDPALREAELGKLPDADRINIAETWAAMFSHAAPAKIEGLLGPLRIAARHLRTERAESRGQKVACVGFCMGGSLAALLACEEPELSGAAVFYGNSPSAEKIAGIRCPVIGFYGAEDQRVNAGLPAFAQTMEKEKKTFEYHVYEGAGHAFFNDDAGSYNVKAARDSFARLLTFFTSTLTG